MRIWRKIHRWTGLLMAGFVVFYCATGLIMNHRVHFDYFLLRDRSTVRVPISDVTHIRAAIEDYAQLTDEQTVPSVMKFKADGTMELLYGSHGAVTYVIDPSTGSMEKIVKRPNNPLHFLDKLHKAYRTHPLWLYVSDCAALLIIAVVFSGLFMFRYSRRDVLFLLMGITCFLVSLLFA